MFLWLLLMIVALVVTYMYRVYTKFSRGGVNHLPIIPGLGTIAGAVMRKENITDCLLRNMNAFPDDKFVGQFEMLTPMIIIKDLELLKKVSIKDFDHFVNRRQFTDEYDSLFGRNLLVLKGDEWKDKRASLTAAFTSSKIKQMIPFMSEVGNQMIQRLKDQVAESEKSHIDVEAKALASRFAIDVIASCAFGLKFDSDESANEFYEMTNDISDFTLVRLMKVFTFRCFPKITTLLKLSISSPTTAAFFRNIVLGTMKSREEQGIIREDMIHLLMEAKKGKLVHDMNKQNKKAGFATAEESNMSGPRTKTEWTDTDLVAQAVVFLLAGIETMSSSMSFLMHELAVNPDVQEKLVSEIREHDAKTGGRLDYNSIQTMTYMDMVISEIMRLWPPAPMADRTCVKDYNLGKPNKNSKEDYIIRKGDEMGLPIFFIHRNPAYFPDPEKFDPERFSEKNKHKIVPSSYMPFGLGPRNCIASRFALCEMKVMMYQLMKNFELFASEKTREPIELTTESFDMRIKDGAWVGIKIRQW